jgi:hypothetical protein
MRLKELSGGIEEDESSFLGAFPKVDLLFHIPNSWLCYSGRIFKPHPQHHNGDFLSYSYPWENIQSPVMGISYILPKVLPPPSAGSLVGNQG